MTEPVNGPVWGGSPDPAEPAPEDWLIHSRAFAARSSEIIFLYSPDFEPLYANPAYERIFGRPVTEWLANGVASDLAMVHLDDLGMIEEALASLLSAVSKAEGTPDVLADLTVEVTYRIRRPDGQQRVVRSRVFPVVADDGRVLGIGGIGTDVTAEQATVNALVRARDEAREERLRMARFQNRFIHEGLASHATWVEKIEGMLSGRTTTSELLTLSRQDTYVLMSMDELTSVNSLATTVQRIDIAALLHEAQQVITRLTERSDVTVTTTTSGAATVHSSPDVVSTVLRGLLGFALLRTAPGGVVHTRIDVQDASLTIRVTDDGPPIDAEDLSRLLLPLERLAHESRPGLRIGLAVADAAAALIGGGVSVLPRTGDGAIVTARIPLTSPIDGVNAPS